MITFSIVTITYNAEGVLKRTLDSVLSQSYPQVEHIIVDGASRDATVSIAEDYQAQSAKLAPEHVVKIQSEPDKGLYDAMNKGLKRATGDYILFLNAGDCFPKADTLACVADKAMLCADGPLPAVLYGDTDLVDNEGQFIGHRRLQPPANLTWRSFRHGMLVCHQAFYARLDIAQQNPYNTRYRYSADVDWCIRVMKQAAQQGLSLVRVPAVVALYQQEGQTTIHHRDSLKERFAVMRIHYGLASTVLMHAWFVLRKLLRR